MATARISITEAVEMWHALCLGVWGVKGCRSSTETDCLPSAYAAAKLGLFFPLLRKASMSKNALVTGDETSNNMAVPGDTRQRRTLRIPSGLNSIEVQEWTRLVAERQGQPDGIRPGDGPFLKLAAWSFGRIVLVRPWLAGPTARRARELYLKTTLRLYVGLCHSLHCTPAVPNRSQYERSQAQRSRHENSVRQSR